MSFITKRERVFHELDLYDLPARNEGKLKAYASCTDARAWSHFGSSKTEHLTELIKRNNEVSAPVKYVPTKVIIDTLMVSKNQEIARLRRKIEEFEQMLAVYEELDLDCAQKCEIAKAHAAIKSANKDLDELCLNLDTSTYTDGFETESFETGKSRSAQYSISASIKSRGAESDRSRGDAWTIMSHDKEVTSQANQTSPVCPCDVSVSVHDPRIEEMQDEIISKDAKLNAMHNSLAILENDICEPFGIYAHIYTALEKIYGILSQNSKYKQYLNLMTAGKDIRCIDIKGKILFKMKVLEKFCLALVAPCSKEFSCSNAKDCYCYRSNVKSSIALDYHIEPEECSSSHSTKRSQLVADIMEHEEMKEILSKDSTHDKIDDFETVSDTAVVINEENQKRLKDLQECYDDLLNCYENSKHEIDCLRVKCVKYEELELELEHLRSQLKECNVLWNEKEHYRKRSEDLDSLKQQYIVLAEESSGLEAKLKAESEINHIKTEAIEELRDQNLFLEKKLNDLYISFEKEKTNVQCQLQASECKCMCQEQQIKSLSSQIVKLLEQVPENIPHEDTTRTLFLTQENEVLKEQLKHYQDIEQEFQDKISLVKDLEAKIAEWTAAYKEITDRNRYLEDCINNQKVEKERLLNENMKLLDKISDKSVAVDNLMDIINTKSVEIEKLTHENLNFSEQLQILGENFKKQVNLSQLENQELLRKVNDYDAIVEKQEDLSNALKEKMHEYEALKKQLKQTLEENEKLNSDLNGLLNENTQHKQSMEMVRRESCLMQNKLSELETVAQQFMNLKEAFERMKTEKNGIENELRKKASQLDSAIYSINLNRKESGELLRQSESIKNELATLNFVNQTYAIDNESLKNDIRLLREENQDLKNKCAGLSVLEQELSDLKKAVDDLLKENKELEQGLEIKNQECCNLCNTLKNKIGENQALNEKLKNLHTQHLEAINSLKGLEKVNERNLLALNTAKEETSALNEKLRRQKALEVEYDKLKSDHDTVRSEKEIQQRELQTQISDLQSEKRVLQSKTDDLLTHNNDLEKALITTRNELLSAQSSSQEKIPHADLMEEINKMKLEKAAGQVKIRELLDRLDESEQVITNFKDDVNARDHRIAIMQNQINDLEDEVRNLQTLLEQAIEVGNEVQNTNQSIELARRQIDAHHSKASHNIKLELAMLQQSKSKLEDQLSKTKLINEMSSQEIKQKYVIEIKELNNEREIIVKEIKNLEIFSMGDSKLTPDHCELDHILDSLNRIAEAFEARRRNIATLEQKLAKVNASSQLILNTIQNTNEAKKYFENEKQKIINEKENALKEKLSMEKQLNDLKEELGSQISHDKGVIIDLETEILNNKLIIDEINVSNKMHTMKLEGEIQSFKDLYHNSLSQISELKDRLNSSAAEKDKKEEIIRSLMIDLANKSKDASGLESEIAILVEKLQQEAEQKLMANHYRDMSSQTDNIVMPTSSDRTESHDSTDKFPKVDKLHTNEFQNRDSVIPDYDPLLLNEVQILPVELEPTFDFVKSSYLNYKIKRLSPGILEYHSIPPLIDGLHPEKEKPETSRNFSCAVDSDSYKLQDTETQLINQELVDIYQNPSNDIHKSSQIIEISTQKQKSITDGKVIDSVNPKIKNNNKISEKVKLTRDHVDKDDIPPSNTDIVVIFNDGEKTQKENPNQQNYIQSDKQKHKSSDKITELRANKLVEESYNHERSYPKSAKINSTGNALSQTKEQKPKKDKIKLNINLPQVRADSHSFVTTADNESHSLESYTHSHLIRETISDTTVMTPSSGEDICKFGTSSLPTISNTDNTYLGSTSFIELPSKKTSFTNDNSNQSKNKVSIKNFVGKKDQHINENRTVAMKSKPQQFSSQAESLPKSNDKAGNSTARFRTNVKSQEKSVHKILHQNLSHSSLNNLPFDPFVINTQTKMDDKQEHEKTKNIADDHTAHLIPDDLSKSMADILSQRYFTQDSDNDYDDIKSNFINDVKTRKKINRISQPNSAELGRHEESNDLSHRSLYDEKSKAKTSKLSRDDISQDSKRKSPKSKLKTDKMSQLLVLDQESDGINSGSSNLMGHFLNDRKSKTNSYRTQVEADIFPKVIRSGTVIQGDDGKNSDKKQRNSFAYNYILDSVKSDFEDVTDSNSEKFQSNARYAIEKSPLLVDIIKPETLNKVNERPLSYVSQGVLAKLDTSSKYYEHVIYTLRKSVEDIEKDHKMQIEAIKIQYDKNINNIINEHNQGVKNIQSIHEDTLLDIMRVHENEVDNLRSMSIEAMRKVEKLERECLLLKSRVSVDNNELLDEVPTKCISAQKPKNTLQSDTKVLTKTTIDAFNVNPKMRLHGPCTCSLDINLSDTIRNIFEQVDIEQRKIAETTYLKYIANKITNGHIEVLDTQELSFLHLKVCRTWKSKLNKEEALQKKIDSLEVELINKQRSAQQHMVELDRKVAQEKRRLEEVREAICRSSPANVLESRPVPIRMAAENKYNNSCACNIVPHELTEAGDIVTAGPTGPTRLKKAKAENRGTLTRTDIGERRDRRLYTDEPPTRLRRQHERPPQRTAKK